MVPRFDGYYLSDCQRHEEWHAGVHMVEDYFEFLKLFDDGFWLRKTHPTSDLDFAAYLGGITEQAFRDGLAGRDTLDAEFNFLHQTGRFAQRVDRLEFEFRHFLVAMRRNSLIRTTTRAQCATQQLIVVVFQTLGIRCRSKPIPNLFP